MCSGSLLTPGHAAGGERFPHVQYAPLSLREIPLGDACAAEIFWPPSLPKPLRGGFWIGTQHATYNRGKVSVADKTRCRDSNDFPESSAGMMPRQRPLDTIAGTSECRRRKNTERSPLQTWTATVFLADQQQLQPSAAILIPLARKLQKVLLVRLPPFTLLHTALFSAQRGPGARIGLSAARGWWVAGG